MQNQNAEVIPIIEVAAQVPPLMARELCINGLAQSVPKFQTRAEAAEMLSSWYPGDELALRALHKQISQQPQAA